MTPPTRLEAGQHHPIIPSYEILCGLIPGFRDSHKGIQMWDAKPLPTDWQGWGIFWDLND